MCEGAEMKVEVQKWALYSMVPMVSRDAIPQGEHL